MSDTQPAGQTPGTASLPPPEVGPPRPPEPSTLPAQPHGDSPAAAGGHPGTLDGPGVLGRALLDREGDLWRQHPEGGDRWRDRLVDPEAEWWRAATVGAYYGPVREVLLVDPAHLQPAGRVLDAARRVAGLRTLGDALDWRHVAALHRRLRAAVDAYDRPTTGTESAPEPTDVPISYQVSSRPAGDGPGWTRGDIADAQNTLRHGGKRPDLADQLEALLADRDRWAKVSGKWADETIAARNATDAARAELAEAAKGFLDACNRLTMEREEARRELAEVTADRDRLRAEVDELREVNRLWSIGAVTGEIGGEQ